MLECVPNVSEGRRVEVLDALASAWVREQFVAQGLEPASSTPQAFGAYLAGEVAKWAKVVKASGATPE